VGGWALVVVGVALAAASVWSRGRWATVGAEGHGCLWSVTLSGGLVQGSLQRGALTIIHGNGDWETGREPAKGAWRWRTSVTAVSPEWHGWGWVWALALHEEGWQRTAAAPVWVFAAGALGSGAGLVWWGRRARGVPGRCAECGYDLRGLGSGAVCPECGGKA
jgi:hypothetical protein